MTRRFLLSLIPAALVAKDAPKPLAPNPFPMYHEWKRMKTIKAGHSFSIEAEYIVNPVNPGCYSPTLLRFMVEANDPSPGATAALEST